MGRPPKELATRAEPFAAHPQVFVAPPGHPLLLGGQEAKGLFGGISPRRLRDAVPLKNLRMEPVGRDMLIQADFQTR